MRSAPYAIARPSVCLSSAGCIKNRLKLGSCNFHRTVAPSLCGISFIQKFWRVPEASKIAQNTSYFLALCVNISKTVSGMVTVTINHQQEITYRCFAVDFFVRSCILYTVHAPMLRACISLAFYRAMHLSAKLSIAIACRLSVCPSVCLWRWWIVIT